MHACSAFVCLSVSRSPTKLLWTEKERHEKGMHCSFSIALFALIDYCPLQKQQQQRRHTIIYLVCAIYWRRSRKGVFSCLFSACFLCRSIFLFLFFGAVFYLFVRSIVHFVHFLLLQKSEFTILFLWRLQNATAAVAGAIDWRGN